ncbi:isoflavone reductase family protein [Paraphaeosphaeria sporulosa]
MLREMKEDVLNHIKKIKLPYTVVDIGWGYQVNLPRLPSGRIDYAVMNFSDGIDGNGDVPIAFTDLRDIGIYVTHIISDPRTLNRMVFAYNEIYTQNQLYDMLERLSGETLECKYVTAEELADRIDALEATQPAPDSIDFVTLTMLQCRYSCGIRGDNTPEYAQYLGYLLAEDLYPDFKGVTFERYAQEVIEGKGRRVYEHLMDLPSIKAMNEARQ